MAALHKELERKYKLQLSFMKVFRARVLALNHIRGDFERQYTFLREYVLELKARNPGTTVIIGVESEPNFSLPTRVFKRIYVCLGPLKEGFRYGQREILGLDGAFMKGPYPGQVLNAVGLDGNNGIYPLAYAIVEAETKSSWSWFLECLGSDLDMGTNTNFTFISDRQKDLVPALAKVFPSAEHRYYVRHILDNMKLYWKGKPLKEHLWKCARAAIIPEFNRAMAEFQKYNNQAYNWLKSIPAEHWSRSHFTGRAHSDILLNNLCEVFNAKIVDRRDRPIISALEFIREYLMKKIVTVQCLIAKSSGPLTPTAQAILDKNKDDASKCRCIYNGNWKFQVTGEYYEQYVVDMAQKTCSCRHWDLTGIPCKHAIAALWDQVEHGQQVQLAEELVHPCYLLATWNKMYSFTIEPINGPQLWPTSDCPTTLVHPKHKKQIYSY